MMWGEVSPERGRDSAPTLPGQQSGGVGRSAQLGSNRLGARQALECS